MARPLRMESEAGVYHVLNPPSPSATAGKPGQLPGGHLSHREGEGRVHAMPGRGLWKDRLAGACLVHHVQSLPSGALDAAREPGGRDALVAGHVFGPVQPVEMKGFFPAESQVARVNLQAKPVLL